MPKLWKPHTYQKTGSAWLTRPRRAAAALWCEPGLGKTTMALAAFQELRKTRKKLKGLVICPLRVGYEVWTSQPHGELGKWSQFAKLRETLLHGRYKDDLFEAALAGELPTDLYVINYDGIPWLTQEQRLMKLFAQGVDVLILDELSKMKHPRTQRFKALKPYLELFKRRWGLTGSPASNGLLDLFGQAYVLDLGQCLGPYITHYRNEYFVQSGFRGYKWAPRKNAAALIYKKLKPLALSMKASDYLDLPQLLPLEYRTTLPEKAMRQYKELEVQFLTEIDNEIVTAVNAAAASLKCRQAASGGAYGKGKKALAVHDAKTQMLAELVDELQGQPLLVSYEFNHDLERIRQTLGKTLPAINGKTPAKLTTQYIRDWNAGKIPILCGHPVAMAHGLNLQEGGSRVCFFSLPWDFEAYDQLIRRLWRQGNKASRVLVYHFIARNTIDETIMQVLKSKDRTQQALMAALKIRAKQLIQRTKV